MYAVIISTQHNKLSITRVHPCTLCKPTFILLLWEWAMVLEGGRECKAADWARLEFTHCLSYLIYQTLIIIPLIKCHFSYNCHGSSVPISVQKWSEYTKTNWQSWKHSLCIVVWRASVNDSHEEQDVRHQLHRLCWRLCQLKLLTRFL